MHCGFPHPDLLLAVLNQRQKHEIEIYAGIEPIGWDVGVSRPIDKEKKKDTKGCVDIERKLDAILGQFPVIEKPVKRQKSEDRL